MEVSIRNHVIMADHVFLKSKNRLSSLLKIHQKYNDYEKMNNIYLMDWPKIQVIDEKICEIENSLEHFEFWTKPHFSVELEIK